jgi:hypothetical protein
MGEPNNPIASVRLTGFDPKPRYRFAESEYRIGSVCIHVFRFVE